MKWDAGGSMWAIECLPFFNQLTIDPFAVWQIAPSPTETKSKKAKNLFLHFTIIISYHCNYPLILKKVQHNNSSYWFFGPYKLRIVEKLSGRLVSDQNWQILMVELTVGMTFEFCQPSDTGRVLYNIHSTASVALTDCERPSLISLLTSTWCLLISATERTILSRY